MTDYKYRKRFTYEGKRYNVYADSLTELGEKMERKKTELRNDPRIITERVTLSQWALRCINTYKTGQKPVTRRSYTNRVKHCILSYLGERPVKDIKPMELQDVLNLQAGHSKTQINEVYQAMRFLFMHAVENKLRNDDPSLYLTKPSGTHNQRRALTENEREAVINVAMTDRRYYVYLLMIYCGCRPSEAVECMGRDIEYKDGYAVLHIRGTKTKNADRYVPIPDDLLDLIKGTGPFEYIAVTQDGNKITNMARLWHSFKRQLNIYMGCAMYRNKLIPPYPVAPDLVAYCLRHEYCSNLARLGVDVRVAQKLMGHSDVQMTANIYTHIELSDIISVANIITGSEIHAASNGESKNRPPSRPSKTDKNR